MLRTVLFMATLLAASSAVPARAQAALFDAPALDEAALAQERGGFELPGGIKVAISVQITTSVDGAQLLRTIWQVTDAGTIAASQVSGENPVALDPRGAVVRARLPGLLVENLIGQRLGSVIANSADGRTIDQQMNVDLTLSDVPPLSIGSAIFRIQAPGLDSGTLRASGG